MNDCLDIIVFLIDDFGIFFMIYNVRKIDRIFLLNFLIIFQ